MKILALDTSGETGSIAIVQDNLLLYESVWEAKTGHTVELSFQTQQALRKASSQLSEINAFAVTIGPGSFTGVRIALSFLKGLALLEEKPVVGVSTLLVLAASVQDQGLICPILDARREEVFSAVYEYRSGEYRPILEERAQTPESFFRVLEEKTLESELPIFFLGSGVRKYSSWVQSFPKKEKVILSHSCDSIKASLLGKLAIQKIEQGEFLKGADQLTPEYLRASEAELRLKKVET